VGRVPDFAPVGGRQRRAVPEMAGLAGTAIKEEWSCGRAVNLRVSAPPDRSPSRAPANGEERDMTAHPHIDPLDNPLL